MYVHDDVVHCIVLVWPIDFLWLVCVCMCVYDTV